MSNVLLYNCVALVATVFSPPPPPTRRRRREEEEEEEDPLCSDFPLTQTHHHHATKPRRAKKVKLGVCAMNKKSPRRTCNPFSNA